MVQRRIWLAPLLLVLATLPLSQSHAFVSEGFASYYGARFNGRLTASGERFDMHAMTAAHRSLDFGTRVLVTNKDNGRSVEVTINDRGPYVAGRTIDLSKEAARQLGMLGRGVARVELEVVGTADSRSRLTADPAQQILIDLF